MKITIRHERRKRGELVIAVHQDGPVAAYLHRKDRRGEWTATYHDHASPAAIATLAAIHNFVTHNPVQSPLTY